ncbi:hypothetical protein FB451DRAFT_1295322 [Mycena latifolia]|nr:hypothetical protein FB451DRAFT_1295322 [Mycena latifolia]
MRPVVSTDGSPSTAFEMTLQTSCCRYSMQSASIYCGAEPPTTSIDFFEDDYDEYRPWELQILPDEPLPHPPRNGMPASRSNCCGASVHPQAAESVLVRGNSDGTQGDGGAARHGDDGVALSRARGEIGVWAVAWAVLSDLSYVPGYKRRTTYSSYRT